MVQSDVLACGSPVSPSPFTEEPAFPPRHALSRSVTEKVAVQMWLRPGLSVLFPPVDLCVRFCDSPVLLGLMSLSSVVWTQLA